MLSLRRSDPTRARLWHVTPIHLCFFTGRVRKSAGNGAGGAAAMAPKELVTNGGGSSRGKYPILNRSFKVATSPPPIAVPVESTWRLTPQHCRHRAEAKRRRGVPKGKARQRRSGNAMLCAVRRCIHLQPRISEIDNHLQCLLCNVQLLFGLLPHFTIGLARMHTNVQVPFAESLRGYLGMPLDDTPNLNGA